MTPYQDIVKNQLTAFGYSQKTLATMTGIKESALSHYLTGSRKPSIKNFYLINKALQIDSDAALHHMFTED